MMKESDPDKRFVKSLMGMPAPIAVEEPVSSVPPRPKSGPKKPKMREALDEDAEALNGTLKDEKLRINATSDATERNGASHNGADRNGAAKDGIAKDGAAKNGVAKNGARSGSSSGNSQRNRKKRH
jgi:hypothetical protein